MPWAFPPKRRRSRPRPILSAFSLELMIAAGLIAFFILVRVTLSVEKPNPAQHIAEMVHELIGGQAEQVIGHGYQRFQAYVTCIFLFVLINNLIGLIPGMTAPTSSIMVTLGLAVPTFLYYNFQGLRGAGTHRLSQALCRAESGGWRG